MEPRADPATHVRRRAAWAPLALLLALALVLFTREPPTAPAPVALPTSDCATAYDGIASNPASGTAYAGEDSERHARRAGGKGLGHSRPMPAVSRVVRTAGDATSPWHAPPPNTARTALPNRGIPAIGDVLRC